MTIELIESALYLDANIYLIKGANRTALIDTGTGAGTDKTLEHIGGALNGRPLDYIFVTHKHQDHSGSVWKIAPALGSKAYAGREDAVSIREGDTEATLGAPFGAILKPCEVNDAKEGDVFDLGGHRLRILETPGHTPGSISIYDEVTGALFSGDLVSINGVGRLDTPLASKKDMIASLEKLKNIRINGLYPGHGPFLTEGGANLIENGLRILDII